MKYIFTKHLLYKLNTLKVVGKKITKKIILETVQEPEDLDSATDYPNLISSAKLDEDRVLRVVYRLEKKKTIIITFYPAKKGRYY